jgi:AcrR family transcriptional regulator
MPTPLQKRRREASKEQLVQIAAELFAERGVEATSLADIAEAAGMTTPALYHYFRNRRELVAEAMQYATWATVDNVRQASKVEGDAADRLRTFLDEHVAFLDRAGPGTVRFVYWAVLDTASDPELSHSIDPGAGATAEFLRGVIDEAKEAGTLAAATDTEVVVELIEACMTGIDYRYATGRAEVPPARAYAGLLDAAARFLDPDGPAAPRSMRS